MTAREANALMRSRRVMLRAEREDDGWVYRVLLDGVTVGTVAQYDGGWLYAKPLGDGITIAGPWRKQKLAVRELLRTC